MLVKLKQSTSSVSNGATNISLSFRFAYNFLQQYNSQNDTLCIASIALFAVMLFIVVTLLTMAIVHSNERLSDLKS